MRELQKIFISHSSADKNLVDTLTQQLERELNSCARIFSASRPDDIPSGADWFNNIRSHLDSADILIILFTGQSENSVWVGYELGYFWHKTGGMRIHALYHPNASIPSPLNMLQGKRISEQEDLKNFVRTLCEQVGTSYTGVFDIHPVIEQVVTLKPSPPRKSLEMFEFLLAFPEKWSKRYIKDRPIWIYAEDSLYQIVVDYDSREQFDEPWVRHYPDSKATKYPVYLQINGVTVHELLFISLDGGRYLVPLPESKTADNERRFIWKRSSLRVKVGSVINEFYDIYPTLEDVARNSGIEIIE